MRKSPINIIRKSGCVSPSKRSNRYVITNMLRIIPCFLFLKIKYGKQKQKRAVRTKNIPITGILNIKNDSELSGGIRNINTPVTINDTIPPTKANNGLFFLRIQNTLI